MIEHTVAFRLKHPEGSKEEMQFLADAMILAKIPGVKNFRRLRQVGFKNNFRFGFTMEFDDAAAYHAYNVHADHVAFVQSKWIPQVVDFMEIDYAAL